MPKKNPAGIDFGSIEDALKDLENVYSEGLGAMNQASQKATEDIKPSHKIIVDVETSAKVEGRNYKVNANLEFIADLNSILNAQTGDIGALLSGLNAGLSEKESKQVTEQLSQPRCIAKLNKFKIKELEFHSDKGKLKEGINKKGVMLIKLDNKKLHLSFESVFAFPELQTKQTLYYAIPSQEKMEKNVVLDIKNPNKKISFSWTEKDKDNLKIKGSLKINKCSQ